MGANNSSEQQNSFDTDKKYQLNNTKRHQSENYLGLMPSDDLVDNFEVVGTESTVQEIKTEGRDGGRSRADVHKIMCEAEEFVNVFNTRTEYACKCQATKFERGTQTDLADISTIKETQKIEYLVEGNKDSQRDKDPSIGSVGGIGGTNKTTSEFEDSSKEQKPVQDILKEILQLRQENERQKENIQTLETYAIFLKEQWVKCQTQNQELLKNNEELLNRLSRIAGDKLREDNPAITDLSDPNRPTKLGEVYSEIYDNEWTDAFEELLSAGYTEVESITTLRLTLLNVLDFCRRKSEGLLKKTEEAVQLLFEEFKQSKLLNNMGHLTMPRQQMEEFCQILREASFEQYLGADILLQQRWKPKQWKPEPGRVEHSNKVETPEVVKKQLKIFRKEVAESMVPLVQKAYMSASWSEFGCLQSLKPYIKKCLFLGWMMVVQSPSLSFSTCSHGDKFNKDLYKEYTKSGPTIDYVVWPALLLKENGPLIGKGVAQGRQT